MVRLLAWSKCGHAYSMPLRSLFRCSAAAPCEIRWRGTAVSPCHCPTAIASPMSKPTPLYFEKEVNEGGVGYVPGYVRGKCVQFTTAYTVYTLTPRKSSKKRIKVRQNYFYSADVVKTGRFAHLKSFVFSEYTLLSPLFSCAFDKLNLVR